MIDCAMLLYGRRLPLPTAQWLLDALTVPGTRNSVLLMVAGGSPLSLDSSATAAGCLSFCRVALIRVVFAVFVASVPLNSVQLQLRGQERPQVSPLAVRQHLAHPGLVHHACGVAAGSDYVFHAGENPGVLGPAAEPVPVPPSDVPAHGVSQQLCAEALAGDELKRRLELFTGPCAAELLPGGFRQRVDYRLVSVPVRAPCFAGC